MFLTCVKARPQHRKFRALLFTKSVWVLLCAIVNCNKDCEMGPPAYSPYPSNIVILCYVFNGKALSLAFAIYLSLDSVVA